MKLIFLWPVISMLSASHHVEMYYQVDESVRERAVTVKMMQDRLHTLERRMDKIQESVKNISFPPEYVSDELELLKHDKRSLIYLIASMKEER